MLEQAVIKIGKEALLMVLIISGPAVIVSMIVGLVISIFQATTQVQEFTLTFVPKLIAVFAVLLILGSWMLTQMLKFSNYLFSIFPTLLQ
jgi:flagellar biosynthetic protein FliQ